MRQIITFVLILIYYSAIGQELSLVVQSGHSAPITDVKLSADNKYIITAAEDKLIIVWDRKTQKQFRVLKGHTDIVTALAVNKFEPEYIYSISNDNTFRKWMISTGECVQILDLKSPLGALDFSPVSCKFVVGSKGLFLIDSSLKEVEIIDVTNGGLLMTPSLIESVAFDKEGKQVAFSDGKGMVGSIDFFNDYIYTSSHPLGLSDKSLGLTGQENNYNGILISTQAVSKVKYSDDGKYLYLTNYKGGFSRHQINTIAERRSPVFINFKRMNDFEDIGNSFALGNQSGKIIIISKRSLFRKKRFKAHKDEIKALDLSQDKSILVSTSVKGEIKVWDTKYFKLLESYSGKTNRINDITFSNDDKTIFIGFSNGLIRSFNLDNFLSATLDLNEKFNGLNEMKKINLRNLQFQNDSLIISLLKTKQSAEFLWMYDYMKDYNVFWDYVNDQYKINSLLTQSKLITDYQTNYKINLSSGTPTLLDSDNLSFTSTDFGISGMIISDNLMIYQDGILLHTINTMHSDRVSSIFYNAKGNFVATASWDGLVKFWDVKTGKLVMTLVLTGNDQFTMINPEGYYFASKNSFENISFMYKNEIFSFDQFDLKFNRPDIVLSGISNLIDSNKIMLYNLAYKKRLSKLGINESKLELNESIPILSMDYTKEIDNHYLYLNLHASISEDSLNKIHINVNGVPEFTILGKSIYGKEFNDSVKINLSPGKNLIQAYVTSTNGISSLKREIVVNGNNKSEKRTLFLVAIGASEYKQNEFNLTYAAKDAVDVSNYFKINNVYDSLVVVQLLNSQVTKANIERLSLQLKEADENDVVILFAAGHGLLSKNMDFYFAAYDMNFNMPQENGIPYSLFDDILDNCKSRYKCLIIDACHSGEIDKDEVAYHNNTVENEGTIKFRHINSKNETQDSISVEEIFERGAKTVYFGGEKSMGSFELSKLLFADMRPNNGTTVISSAGGVEFAMEGDIWKNGVFTYALLKGLSSGEADLNHDRSITISEIHKYVSAKVVELTEGMQNPTSRTENIYNDFKIK